MTGSDIPDRHADSALTNPQLGNRSVYGQTLNQSWEILPVQSNLRKPFGSHTAALRVLVCAHTLQQLKRCFRTEETLKRYDYNSSHVRSQGFATEQWQSAVNQVQKSQRWVEPNQRSVTNQCSNIRSFSGPSLSPHAKFDRPRHPKTCGGNWQGGSFTSGALESLPSLIGQQMEKRVQATSAPQGCQIGFLTPNFTNLTFFRDSWR